MTPADVDDLPDVTWDAMVARMVSEAAAITAANRDLNRKR